ncbi:hypothetical protein V9W64_10520 [Neisseria leonii]|uniref:Uncharacterized protein n=1 Tax=Neisseria leonii TaxID=2995413 RepID=A0A9X4IEM3_9NEIS|nr:hypothetical protein [Neisseria sp. 51.81]MDD9328243.1 hypothetical protein [Neisseria sp. 51.81]
MNTDDKLNRARHILKNLPKAKQVPRSRHKLPSYLRYLRESVLGMTQSDFWSMFGIPGGTGAKYETTAAPDVQSRKISEAKLAAVMQALNLEWEFNSELGYFSEDGTVFHPTTKGVEVLYAVTASELTAEDIKLFGELVRHLRAK